MSSSDPSQPAADSPLVTLRARDGISLVGLLIVGGVVVATGTPRDLIVAVPLVLAAGVLPSPLAFAAGQLALVPSLTPDTTLAIGVTQLALLVVLTEPARDHAFRPAIVATAGVYAALLGLLFVGFRESLLVAAGMLCLAVAGGTYLARRMTLVRLGRVPTRTTSDNDTATDSDVSHD